MPIDNDYNRMVADNVAMMNQRFIQNLGDEQLSASHTFGNADKNNRGLSGGTILGMKQGITFTSPEAEKDAYVSEAVQPESGLVVKAGKYASVRDLGSMDEPVSVLSEPVKSIFIGGYELHGDDDELEEGGVVISDEGKAYRKEGGFFWFIAIAIKFAIAAAKKAAALALKLAIKAAKAAVKKAVKKKIKGKVKTKIKQKIKDRIKQEIKKQVKDEVKGRVKQSAREQLEKLKTGNPKVDDSGFERIIDRTMQLDAMRADPDADQQRIKEKEAAIRRAETIAHYKGYKDYLIKNRVGKDSNFTQADVDELKRKIEEKVRKEEAYTLKRAKEAAEREKQKIRDEKNAAINQYEQAAANKFGTKQAISDKDQSIVQLKKDFKQLLTDKKIARVRKEQLLLQQKEEYAAAAKEKDEAIKNYIRELGTPEERAQLKAKEAEEKRLYLKAKEDEKKLEAENKRLMEEARLEEEKKAKELSERLAKEEKERKEKAEKEAAEEVIKIRAEKAKEAERVGNINEYSGQQRERQPVVERSSFFGGNKNNRHSVVKKVMNEQGLSMIEASKYVKKNGLY